MTLTTTLAEIRSHKPCVCGFKKIRDHFGVSSEDAKTHDKPFPIALLIETNGLDDALWVTAHVAPDAMTRFLLARLDTGKHSALKTLRGLAGDWAAQIKAVQAVVDLLKRKLAGEDVERDLESTRNAAYAAAPARAAAANAAYAAAYAARATLASTYCAGAAAARAAAKYDLMAALSAQHHHKGDTK